MVSKSPSRAAPREPEARSTEGVQLVPEQVFLLNHLVQTCRAITESETKDRKRTHKASKTANIDKVSASKTVVYLNKQVKTEDP